MAASLRPGRKRAERESAYTQASDDEREFALFTGVPYYSWSEEQKKEQTRTWRQEELGIVCCEGSRGFWLQQPCRCDGMGR